MSLEVLTQQLTACFAEHISCNVTGEQLTCVLDVQELIPICVTLRDHHDFQFDQLIDLCVVDYLTYGLTEWETTAATSTGFSRGVTRLAQGESKVSADIPARFVVVYHLLSTVYNQRIRLKVPVPDDLRVSSVTEIWRSANWYEREGFDLFGVLFVDHPDLRRILTDYGFVGHPFRKDFPLIGEVEMRYDAKEQRVVYEPVSIKPRTLVPKVIRDPAPAPSQEVESAK